MSKNDKKRVRPTLAQVKQLRQKLAQVSKQHLEDRKAEEAKFKASQERLAAENIALRGALDKVRFAAKVSRRDGIAHGEELNRAKGLLAVALQDLPRPSVLANQIWRFLGFEEEQLLPTLVESALPRPAQSDAAPTV